MKMYIVACPNDELYHHGIPGMKWGVRRYQNEDGSRTALGRRHENSLLKRAVSRFSNMTTEKQRKIQTQQLKADFKTNREKLKAKRNEAIRNAGSKYQKDFDSTDDAVERDRLVGDYLNNVKNANQTYKNDLRASKKELTKNRIHAMANQSMVKTAVNGALKAGALAAVSSLGTSALRKKGHYVAAAVLKTGAMATAYGMGRHTKKQIKQIAYARGAEGVMYTAKNAKNMYKAGSKAISNAVKKRMNE